MSDDNKKVVVKNELECWEETTPICPYCGYKEQAEDIMGLEVQDTETVLVCLRCNEEYLLDVESKVLFTSTPMEGWKGVKIKKTTSDVPGGVH